MFLGMRPVENNSAHVKPLKNGGGLIEVTPCQADTEGVESMTRTRIDLNDSKNLIGVLGWMVIGDGNLTLRGRQKNAFFQLTHKESCEDYIRMKESILSLVSGVSVKRRWHSKAGEYYWQLWTQCHPIYTQLWRGIYLNKRKTITPHSAKTLNEMALAILYQDDGRYNKSKSTISINKPLFSIPELELLAKYIVDKFGILFRVRKSCKLKDGTQGHELGLRYSDKDKFFNIISPYIVPSMRYKVTSGGSHNLTGEVLRTV